MLVKIYCKTKELLESIENHYGIYRKYSVNVRKFYKLWEITREFVDISCKTIKLLKVTKEFCGKFSVKLRKYGI